MSEIWVIESSTDGIIWCLHGEEKSGAEAELWSRLLEIDDENKGIMFRAAKYTRTEPQE